MLCLVEPGGRPGPRFFSVVVVTVDVEEVVLVSSLLEPEPLVVADVTEDVVEDVDFCRFRRATGTKKKKK